ncbi:MAG: YcxB family protein, partial [Clostridiales bacterium]|nr:YcxB family protein [Clostridiales bacterium]
SEDAEALRRTVLTAIPQTRQKIEAPLIPTAAGHISRPDDEPDNEEWRDENSISVEINYSRDEFVKIAADTALRGLLKLLPLYSFMSLMAALMFGLLYDFGFGIAVYVAVNAGLFLFRIFGARTRAGRAYDNMTSTRINVLLADKGIEVNSSEKSDRIKLEWKDVQRAVERPNDVEFFSESIFLRIPKRCIEDFDALRAFVDSHHQPTKK